MGDKAPDIYSMYNGPQTSMSRSELCSLTEWLVLKRFPPMEQTPSLIATQMKVGRVGIKFVPRFSILEIRRA